MSGLRLKVEYHSSSHVTSLIEVSTEPGEHCVRVLIDTEDLNAHPLERNLAPDEARALASALVHYASEIEDGRA